MEKKTPAFRLSKNNFCWSFAFDFGNVSWTSTLTHTFERSTKKDWKGTISQLRSNYQPTKPKKFFTKKLITTSGNPTKPRVYSQYRSPKRPDPGPLTRRPKTHRKILASKRCIRTQSSPCSKSNDSELAFTALWKRIFGPKNHWTLQWRGLNLYSRGVLGLQNS